MTDLLAPLAHGLPHVEGTSLRLRALVAADADAVFELYRDREANRFGYSPEMSTPADAARLIDEISALAERRTLFSSAEELGIPGALDLLEIDDLLQQLAGIDARMAEVVQQRVFAGMTVPECAVALGVSERTIASDWRLACTWLQEHVGGTS